MKYTSLGKSGLQVSEICLGTMTFGEQNTEAEGHEQLDYALAHGINFIDTAELYAVPANPATQGKTEEIIGSWIKSRQNRSAFILATKIAGNLPFAGHIRQPLGYQRAMLDDAISKSLQRLQTDYIDLYQLHWPNRKTNFFGQLGYVHREDDPWEDEFLDVLQSMDALIKSGKIRYWGLSNETPWGLMRVLHLAALHGLPAPVSIQNPYSLLNRTFEIGLAEICHREQIAMLPYSPTAFGLLSGKFHRGEDTPQDRMNQFAQQLPRYKGALAWEATTHYLAIAEKHGLNPIQMALAFVNDRSFVCSNIIGATNMQQLAENIGSAELTLSPAILQEIEAVHHKIPNPAP